MNSVRLSYAISHLNAAAAVLDELGLTEEASDARSLAERAEVHRPKEKTQ